MNFKKPQEIVWVKVNGDVTSGVLTNDLTMVPKDFRPVEGASVKRKVPGLKSLFCLERGYWISLYPKNILAI